MIIIKLNLLGKSCRLLSCSLEFPFSLDLSIALSRFCSHFHRTDSDYQGDKSLLGPYVTPRKTPLITNKLRP